MPSSRGSSLTGIDPQIPASQADPLSSEPPWKHWNVGWGLIFFTWFYVYSEICPSPRWCLCLQESFINLTTAQIWVDMLPAIFLLSHPTWSMMATIIRSSSQHLTVTLFKFWTLTPTLRWSCSRKPKESIHSDAQQVLTAIFRAGEP